MPERNFLPHEYRKIVLLAMVALFPLTTLSSNASTNDGTDHANSTCRVGSKHRGTGPPA
jgi:hypothetical protein